MSKPPEFSRHNDPHGFLASTLQRQREETARKQQRDLAQQQKIREHEIAHNRIQAFLTGYVPAVAAAAINKDIDPNITFAHYTKVRQFEHRRRLFLPDKIVQVKSLKELDASKAPVLGWSLYTRSYIHTAEVPNGKYERDGSNEGGHMGVDIVKTDLRGGVALTVGGLLLKYDTTDTSDLNRKHPTIDISHSHMLKPRDIADTDRSYESHVANFVIQHGLIDRLE